MFVFACACNVLCIMFVFVLSLSSLRDTCSIIVWFLNSTSQRIYSASIEASVRRGSRTAWRWRWSKSTWRNGVWSRSRRRWRCTRRHRITRTSWSSSPRSKLLRNRLGKALVMHCCVFGFGKRVDGVCIFLLLRLLYIVYWPMCSPRVDQ